MSRFNWFEWYCNQPRVDWTRQYLEEFPMPEHMEVNLLRARVRELEKAAREASFILRSSPNPNTVEAADVLDNAVLSEAKCLDQCSIVYWACTWQTT